MAEYSGLDEFAQTRGADDLFDDEIIPVTAEEQTTVDEPAQSQLESKSEPQSQPEHEPEPPSQPKVDTQSQDGAGAEEAVESGRDSTPVHSDAPRVRGDRRGRGRGRGRGGRGRDTSRKQDGSRDRIEQAVEPETQTQTQTQPQPEAHDEDKAETGTADKVEGHDGHEGHDEAEAPRVPAVRGDRSATGGVKKPKLTEEELSRKIAAAREHAAKVAAAHARAEADQASFMEREKVAEKKRREERANRRVMDNEREQNRLRKLGALGGREWDADKPEEQVNARGGQYRRGMHGGVSGVARKGLEDSIYSQAEPVEHQGQGYRGRGNGRGRGGRGRGRGRGGHRGQDYAEEKPSDIPPEKAPTPVISNETDFPSLPGGEKKDADTKEKPTPDEKLLSPISGATSSWADQVEAQRE